MSHQPWTQEQAEKWAMESDVVRYATFEDDAIEGFKAGMAKAAAEFERIVAELKEKLEVFRNREYGFENELELKQTIARQSRVIEKLKVINRDFAWHYDECSSIVEDNAPCDCGLRKTRTEIATIEKGKA